MFTPVGLLIETPLIICVHPDLPVKSLAELVAYAKANPGKISWGSQGFGTSPHLLAEMFKLETGVNIVHMPYRGTAPMLAAILAGEIQMVADASTTGLPHLQSGKLRPLAIAGAERFSQLPDVPTTTEAGYPKLQAPFWLGVVAPAGTPPAIINQLNQHSASASISRRHARASQVSAPRSRSALQPSSARCLPANSRSGSPL